MVNIGASTTSLAVFEEGELLHTAVLPIGSEHITADIAIGLRCPINIADRIKIEIGSANHNKFNKKEEIDIKELMAKEESEEDMGLVSGRYIAEIIEARVDEIFEKVDGELKKISRSGMLPAGIFLVGGGAKLNDIVETAKKKLRLPVCLGTNKNISTVIDKVNDLNFLTALGLVAWGNQVISSQKGFNLPVGKTINKFINKAKKWISSLIP